MISTWRSTATSHEDGFVDQIPKVLFRVAKITWNIHMIIEGKPLRAPAYRGVEIRRFADLSPEPKISNLRHNMTLCDRGPFGRVGNRGIGRIICLQVRTNVCTQIRLFRLKSSRIADQSVRIGFHICLGC